MKITIDNISKELSEFNLDTLTNECIKLRQKLTDMSLISDEEIERYVLIEEELQRRKGVNK